MKTTLITGGAGFLGSHLCDHFIKEKHNVICIDNLKVLQSTSNISHLINHPHFQFIEEDITCFSRNIYEKIDNVLHLASLASPKDYLKYPIETLRVGSEGTLKALQIALDNKARFLLASSSEVYGDPLVHPQPESYNGNVDPVCLRGVYDESKRFAEALTMAYHRSCNLDTKIARIFNTYGPRMREEDGRVVPNFINQALSGKPLTIYGIGSQTRSLCYVDDMVEGIYKLLYSTWNDPINLGNPDEISIYDLAREIRILTNRESAKISYNVLPKNDPKTRQPDISLANKVLKWYPSINRKEGLRKTIQYFGQLHKGKEKVNAR